MAEPEVKGPHALANTDVKELKDLSPIQIYLDVMCNHLGMRYEKAREENGNVVVEYSICGNIRGDESHIKKHINRAEIKCESVKISVAEESPYRESVEIKFDSATVSELETRMKEVAPGAIGKYGNTAEKLAFEQFQAAVAAK